MIRPTPRHTLADTHSPAPTLYGSATAPPTGRPRGDPGSVCPVPGSRQPLLHEDQLVTVVTEPPVEPFDAGIVRLDQQVDLVAADRRQSALRLRHEPVAEPPAAGRRIDRQPVDPAAPAVPESGRAHVCTPATNAHIVCRLLFEKNKRNPTHNTPKR